MLSFTPPDSEEVFIDTTAPIIQISPPSASVASTLPVSFTITYDDPNFASCTLTSENITLLRTGSANGNLEVTGDGMSRTVTITGISGTAHSEFQ